MKHARDLTDHFREIWITINAKIIEPVNKSTFQKVFIEFTSVRSDIKQGGET